MTIITIRIIPTSRRTSLKRRVFWFYNLFPINCFNRSLSIAQILFKFSLFFSEIVVEIFSTFQQIELCLVVVDSAKYSFECKHCKHSCTLLDYSQCAELILSRKRSRVESISGQSTYFSTRSLLINHIASYLYKPLCQRIRAKKWGREEQSTPVQNRRIRATNGRLLQIDIDMDLCTFWQWTNPVMPIMPKILQIRIENQFHIYIDIVIYIYI